MTDKKCYRSSKISDIPLAKPWQKAVQGGCEIFLSARNSAFVFAIIIANTGATVDTDGSLYNGIFYLNFVLAHRQFGTQNTTRVKYTLLCLLCWRMQLCVSKIKRILSVIHYTNVGLYVFSLPIPLVMIEIIYILCLIIIIKSELWTVTHCIALDHETMVSAVCLSLFLSPQFHIIKNCVDFLWDICCIVCWSITLHSNLSVLSSAR